MCIYPFSFFNSAFLIGIYWLYITDFTMTFSYMHINCFVIFTPIKLSCPHFTPDDLLPFPSLLCSAFISSFIFSNSQGGSVELCTGAQAPSQWLHHWRRCSLFPRTSLPISPHRGLCPLELEPLLPATINCLYVIREGRGSGAPLTPW